VGTDHAAAGESCKIKMLAKKITIIKAFFMKKSSLSLYLKFNPYLLV
jgi:hypothetical protein